MNANRRIHFYLLFGFLSTLLTCIILEFSSRIITANVFPELAKQIEQHQSQLKRSLTQEPQFQPHPYLGYTPSDVELIEDGCLINRVYFTFTKPEHTLRIACLGGSTTKNAYTRWLAEPLQHLFNDKKIEVMDWGCQGWTMAESTINYMIRVQHFSPDIVILHHGINDIAPRVRQDFVVDYSQYRKTFSFQPARAANRIASYSTALSWAQLLMGIRPGDLHSWTVQKNPGPVGEYPGEHTVLLYRNGLESIAQLTQANGAQLIAAGMVYNPTGYLNQRNVDMVIEHNTILRETAEKHSSTYVDLQSLYRHYPEWFMDHCHLRNPGNQSKAQWLSNVIADRLTHSNMLSASVIRQPTPGIWIEWNVDQLDYDGIEIYVQINNDKPQWLTNVNANRSSLLWNDQFKIPLETGTQYRFLLQRIKDKKRYFGPVVQSNSLLFEN